MKGEFTQKGKEAMERFKVESANEVGVNLKQGYNGDLTARQAGSIGGMMVKKMNFCFRNLLLQFALYFFAKRQKKKKTGRGLQIFSAIFKSE